MTRRLTDAEVDALLERVARLANVLERMLPDGNPFGRGEE